MFIKKTKKGKYFYLSLVVSYREGGVPKHKTIASLGRLDELIKSNQLEKISNSILCLLNRDPVEKKELQVEELERLNWGASKVYRNIWNTLNLDRIFNKLQNETNFSIPINEIVFQIVLNRLIKPMSKLKLHGIQQKFLDTTYTELHKFYRVLDFLSDKKESIENLLFASRTNIFNQSLEIIFYDVTTLRFESTHADELKAFGFSKDCRFNEVQVVLGLLVDNLGCPVGFDVFPGNTFEGKTILSAIEKLKKRFAIKRIIIVADRGLNSGENLKYIDELGYKYIVASKIRSFPQYLQEDILNIDNYVTKHESNSDDILKLYSFARENVIKTKIEDLDKNKKVIVKYRLQERVICSWSLKRAEKDQKDRDRLVKKCEKKLEKPSLSKIKASSIKYIDISIKDVPKMNYNKIENDKKHDGFYVIQTNDLQINEKQALDAYHTLWKIEESFSILKSTLQTRPMFHWTSKRIHGHITCCFIAFLLERTLECSLLTNKIEDFSVLKIREALDALECSKIEINGEKYYLRASISPLAKQILKVNNIQIPKSLVPVNQAY